MGLQRASKELASPSVPDRPVPTQFQKDSFLFC